MATNTERRVTEEEVLFVEDALSEFEAEGMTEKKCPWCGGDLEFHIRGSGYSIQCSNCEFKVTARGI